MEDEEVEEAAEVVEEVLNKNGYNRRDDLGQKIIVAAFIAVFGLFIHVVWQAANESGKRSTENSIKIAQLIHMKEDIKEIKRILMERVYPNE